MRQLQKRAAELARIHQQRSIARIADQLRGKIPGVTVEESNEGVSLRGRGLLGRWLVDPGLRFIADMPK